ncbi:MAG: hypothetical protein IJM73_03340 [Spirochaetales bacterium]|nr:hypothetical protein [Spirochaetales bacterium]
MENSVVAADAQGPALTVEVAEFGGLLGSGPVMKVNPWSCEDFIARGGRIPAPVHSFKN